MSSASASASASAVINIKEKFSSRSNIDEYIEKLLNLKFLLESELKDICEKVKM